MLWSFDPFEPLFGLTGRAPVFVPAADVMVGDRDLVLTMDVPGLSQDDLSIEYMDGHLIVKGERSAPAVPENASVTHRERTFGKFERRIRLPDGVDPDAIMANLENGVLSLIVPKPEQLKPKTIEIGTGNEQRQLATAAA
jgi:HSP20 family protein